MTRDLYSDFGEFTLTGIALSPVNGEYRSLITCISAKRHATLSWSSRSPYQRPSERLP